MSTAWWFLLVWVTLGGDEWQASYVDRASDGQSCRAMMEERNGTDPHPFADRWFTCANLPPEAVSVKTCQQGVCITVVRPELLL